MNRLVSMLQGWNPNKLKAFLMTAGKRAKLQRNKHIKDIKLIEREVLQFIQENRSERATIKAEQILQHRKLELAMDIIESICDLLETRMSYIEQCSSLPAELIQPIATLFYASSRAEVPELADVRKQFCA